MTVIICQFRIVNSNTFKLFVLNLYRNRYTEMYLKVEMHIFKNIDKFKTDITQSSIKK